MSVAKIIEISSTSTKSFEDAMQQGIARASQTIKQITGAWVSEQKVVIDTGNIVEYRVNLRLTFILEDAAAARPAKEAKPAKRAKG